MALLRLAAASSPDLRISVLTVDHRLRPESSAEARQVGKWCADLGLSHHILAWAGANAGTGLQARARRARYDLLTQWCGAQGAEALLTAHTLDDQAETVLMRMARTDSIASLAGIPARGTWQGVALVRPLLDCRRADLRAYLERLGQGWIEDPSNDDRRFERVRLRQMLPDLAASGVTPDRLAVLAKSCAVLTAQLEDCARAWFRAALHQDDGFCRFDLSAFDMLPRLLRQRILADLVRHFGGGSDPERAEIDRLDRSLDGKTGLRRTLGGALIWQRGGDVLIGREPGRLDPHPMPVPETGELLWDGRYAVRAPPGSFVLPAPRAGLVRPSRAVPDTVFRTAPAILLRDGRLGDGPDGPGPAAMARFIPFRPSSGW